MKDQHAAMMAGLMAALREVRVSAPAPKAKAVPAPTPVLTTEQIWAQMEQQAARLSTLDLLKVKATRLRSEDPTLNEGDSLVRAAELNPELYRRYAREASRR